MFVRAGQARLRPFCFRFMIDSLLASESIIEVREQYSNQNSPSSEN